MQNGTTEVWTKPLDHGAVAVAVFNRGQSPANVRVEWSQLNLNKPKEVRDLWKRADLEDVTDGYSVELPEHGSALLKVTQ
jgi:alpha-galactosidase